MSPLMPTKPLRIEWVVSWKILLYKGSWLIKKKKTGTSHIQIYARSIGWHAARPSCFSEYGSDIGHQTNGKCKHADKNDVYRCGAKFQNFQGMKMKKKKHWQIPTYKSSQLNFLTHADRNGTSPLLGLRGWPAKAEEYFRFQWLSKR